MALGHTSNLDLWFSLQYLWKGVGGSVLKIRYFHLFLRNTEKGNSHLETAITEGQKENVVEWQEITTGIQLEPEYPL